MFVASYAGLPPGPRLHLSINVQFSLRALYRVFAVTIKLWVGSDRLLQCARPPRYHFITARALYYNARYRLGSARSLYYNARNRLGTARALHYNARRRLGPARALYYNARYRLGTASVPLGPSITVRGTDTPFAFYKALIGSE